jgi:hypothetical protein
VTTKRLRERSITTVAQVEALDEAGVTNSLVLTPRCHET